MQRASGRHDFLTTPLKEYPQQFCCIIALALVKKWHFVLHPWATDVDLPDALADMYQLLDPYHTYSLGQDHAPRCRLR